MRSNNLAFSFFPKQLARGDVVISHGGAGSIYQALLVGIPLLVIPQHLEQLDHGRRVEEVGAGICLPPDCVNRESVMEAVSTLCEQRFKERTAEICQVLSSSRPFEESYIVIKEAC